MGLSTLFSRRKLLAYTLPTGTFLLFTIFFSVTAHAAVGINQEINFQGRLLNGQGAVVPDGYYNMEFKIYQDGDGQSAGDTTGTPAATLKWTEDYLNTGTAQAVRVVNGYLSVELGSVTPFGSSVDWNQDTLWLSMQVGNTATCTITTTFQANCGGDGEMVPMRRLSADPYALNAQLLGGKSSASFVQLAQGLQTDASNVNSIYINKTGTGNIIDLQSNGNEAFDLTNSGNIAFGANANHTLSVTTAGAGAAGNSLTLTAGGAGSGATALAGGDLVVQAGTGGGTNGNGGNILIDAGAANGTGTAGTIKIGTNTASAVIVGGTSQTGTVTMQQSGVSQVITGSATTPTVVIKTTANNSNAFQVQNSTSNRVFGVDTSNNQVVLGQSSAVDGSLLFRNHSGTTGITINSTGAPSSSYTLTLPTAAPNSSLCLETSSGSTTTAAQLVFASCANNNTSISEVNEWDANNTNTVTVSPYAVGDVIVVTTQIPTSGVTVSSIAGGGVSSWSKAVVSAGNGTVNRVEMWIGTVTAIGSSTITVTYSSSPGAEEVTATDFTASGVNASTSWGIESTASQLNSTASSTVTFPNMVPVNGAELYIGYGQVQNPPATAGSTTGFNYIITSTQHNVITYNPSTAANTPYQPTANQNAAGESNTVSAVLTAFVTSTSINNATSLQKANYYVQAATAGSVAGVLQAAGSGTADVLNVRNSSAANVATIGYTGIATFKNSTDSTGAFQVQNSLGNNILTVSTSGNTVALGKATVQDGSLTFNDKTDTNSIVLQAPDTIASNYNLMLPNQSPTAGLCLGTSPSNPNQLIFASCATQVSAASISFVSQWSSTGTSITTLADSPTSTGDLLILYSHAANNVSITGVSGGGVTNWTKVTSNTNTTGQGNNEMWRGAITGTGAATITVTYSAAAGTNELTAQEFTMGSKNGTWAVDTSGAAINSGAQTTINYPSLTPANSSELYAGYAWGQYAMSAGTTTGFTYTATSASDYTAYDTNVTNGSAIQPQASQGTAGNYNSIAALIAAYAGTSVIVNSTATQQANFNVQAATSGTVAGVLQGASSGGADILQLKDSSGNNILTVNGSTTNSLTGIVTGATLGTAGTVAGQLTFAAGANSNSITIAAPSNPGASYYLTLPTTTPAPGQCLASSPNNANQLVFSSCANQVTSVTITAVNHWKSTSVTQSPTLSVSPVNVGDLMTFFVYSSKGNTVTTAPSGCGITWSQIVSANSEYMYRGITTTTGACTISVGISTPSSPTEELAAQEWTTGSNSGSWVIDASGSINNTTSSTTVTYPSLTPQSTKDLYIGYAIGTSTMSAGATAGYTYFAGAGTNIYGAYNTSVSAATQPTASQTTAGTSIADGALIAAYSSSSVISNSTNTQEANFNVQAAISGSVAGVLQAAASGTGDVLDILNAAGTLVDSFSSNGNLLVQPSTASANAFRVQTTTGVNVFSVDTSALRVVVGAGATGEATPSLLVVDSETGTSSDPTEVNGGVYYNATTHTFRCGVDGSWQSCTGLLYSNTSNSAANNNCSNNCSAFSVSAPIPANYCQPGRVFKVTATGFFSSLATASNLQFGVYYGTTLIGALTPAVSVTSANNNYFQISDTITCFSTSSMQSGGTANIQTSGGITTVPITSTGGTTVSTATANNIYIYPVWDTASTSNTATLTQLMVNSY